jgi:hypothetical protein
MQKLSQLSNVLLKYTVAAIIIMVPLYPKFPFLRVPGTFVSIRLEDLLMAWGALLLVWLLLPHLISYLKNHVTQSVLLFLVIGAVSTLSAIFVTQTISANIGLLHWGRRIEYLIPLFLGWEVMRRDRKNLDFFIKIFLIVITLTFVYGLGQRYASWPVIITQNEEYSKGVALRWTPGAHINSTFAGHYDLSTFLIVTLPIIITAFFVIKGKFSKALLFIVTMFGLWLLVNGASRISQVSYLGSVTVALFLARKYIAIPIVLAISILFIATSSNLISRYMQILNIRIPDFQSYSINTVYAAEDSIAPFDTPTPTITPVPVVEDRSTNIRLVVEWPRAIRAFTKNPLLGTGYSSITLATDNDYLRLLGEVGILGALSFLGLWLTIGLEFLKKLPYRKHFSGLEMAFLCGITGGTLGVFLNAVFIDVFEASKFIILFMLLIGFGLGLLQNERKESSS